MAWRARCYECGQDVPITRPLYGKQSLFADGDLGLAIATYEAHPCSPFNSQCLASDSYSLQTRAQAGLSFLRQVVV